MNLIAANEKKKCHLASKKPYSPNLSEQLLLDNLKADQVYALPCGIDTASGKYI